MSLVWLERPGLEGLAPELVARAAGVELDRGGLLEAAVVSGPQAAAPPGLKGRLLGKPVVWLDLALEVGGGDDALRLARAALAVARAAGRAALGTLPPVYAPQPAQNVLVAGAGLAALSAAQEEAALGHPVLLATPFDAAHVPGQDDDPQEVSLLAARLPAQVELAPGTELTELTGAAGGFRARLAGPQGAGWQSFGAVVLAPPGQWASSCEAPGLDPALTQPVWQLRVQEVSGPPDGWLYAAVLAGTARPLTADSFARALRAALALAERPRVQVVLLYSEARVASDHGERLFRQCRQAGVLATRVAPGGLAVREGGRELAWPDPLLGQEMELAPDLIITADQARAARPAFLDNRLLWPSWESLVPDNPRFSGGRSSRTGLYILGALRGTAPGAARRVEAADAAAEMHERLAGKLVPMPVVRDKICARCLTCVRTCPHGVPRHVVDSIHCAPAGCLACGVCAAECPAQAIAPPGWSNPEMFAGLQRALALAAEPRLVLFACQNSALAAAGELSAGGHAWPAGLVINPVVCAGRVGEHLIMKALELGARAVLVAGCHEGNCRSVTGNLRSRLRAGQCSRTLGRLGLAPESVQFLHLASNQPRVLAQAVAQMAARALEG
ncbi:MAG: hydrogenase iron-sulfur subunit [Desulfarculus sp.]|nr:MAG: hydrogenase iron-sulfur subunit [Desulfarculus sp.]